MHIDSLLKFSFILLSSKQSDWCIWTLWLVRIVTHCNAYLSNWTIHNVNYHVRQFQLFIPVFGHCWYLYRWQFLLCAEVSCCNDQLIGWSLTRPLYDLVLVENFCCHLLWQLWVLHPSIWSRFWTQKPPKICLDLSQSLYSPYKLAWSWKRYCCQPEALTPEIVHCQLKKWFVFRERKVKNDFVAEKRCLCMHFYHFHVIFHY